MAHADTSSVKVDTMKAKTRANLPKSAFAIPSQRLYPIHTPKRARAALAYAARPTTRGSYKTVRAAVAKRYGRNHPILQASRKRPGATTTASATRGRSRKTATLAKSTRK
jgi:hypothetical protein